MRMFLLFWYLILENGKDYLMCQNHKMMRRMMNMNLLMTSERISLKKPVNNGL
jgi:hypothetical protein